MLHEQGHQMWGQQAREFWLLELCLLEVGLLAAVVCLQVCQLGLHE